MLGSEAYVARHKSELDKFAAVMIFDTGSGHLSGFYLNGRPELRKPVNDALAVEEAGAFALVLELVEPELAGEITAKLSIPTIGIGSGPHCYGQILVTHDLVGSFPWFRPKFAVAKADVASAIRDAAVKFVQQVKEAGN